MITEQTFETGSVAINWGEGPRRGPPLVLLHGISMWWRTFMPVLPYLSERFHVHAVDFRWPRTVRKSAERLSMGGICPGHC
jgi:pimeloyl-ACP methyl ester carboxylesterase